MNFCDGATRRRGDRAMFFSRPVAKSPRRPVTGSRPLLHPQKNNLNMKLFRLLLALTLAVPLLTLLAGCGNGQAEADEQAEQAEQARTSAVRVETYVVEPVRFEDALQLTGTVEALDDATLSAQSAGTVVSIAERGAFVPAGGTVARLDPAEARAAAAQAQAQVASAQAQATLAEDAYERQLPLYRDSIISAAEFEGVRAQRAQAQAALAQAQAALVQAEQRLSNTRVASPFAGAVEERFVEEGEQVSPGQQVARVVNTRRVKVTGGVPESYAGQIEQGTAVRLRFPAYGGLEADTAAVTFVGSAIDPESRTFPIEIELSNPEQQLKPAMAVQLEVTREVIEDALVIPRSALLRDEEGLHAYVVAGADTAAVARLRTLTLGPESTGRVVVRTGLEAGDRVVVSGQNNLSPGEPVEVARRRESIEAADTSFGDEERAE